MQIIIDSPAALDKFAANTEQHTKIPKTRLKSAIAKGAGFSHVKALETALKPAASSPAPHVPPLPYAMQQLKSWLDDNVDMGTDIHFDNDGEITSEEVATAWEQWVSKQPVNTSSSELPYAIQQLKLWLDDNVNMGTSIHFDNDGEITSEEVVTAWESWLSPRANADNYRLDTSPEKMKEDIIKSCESGALDIIAHDECEEELINNAKKLAAVDSDTLQAALQLLANNGFEEAALTLHKLAGSGLKLNLLNAELKKISEQKVRANLSF
jgi:hypothetical protein